MNLINIHNCYIGLMAVMSLVLVSCADETGLDNSRERGDIVFSAQIGKAVSRITNNQWDGDELVGIKVGETAKTYKVAADGKMSTEDTPYVWDGTSYDVLAWSPLTDEPIDLTDQTTEKKLFDCDLLVSTAKVNSKNMRLVFKHRMTRMWWELQKFEGYTEEEVNNAKISFVGYGAVMYTDGEVTPVGEADQLIATHNTRGEYYRNGEAMLVSGDMWGKPLIRIEIGGDVYTYTPSKDDANDVAKKTGDLLPNVWQRYYLSVSKQGLKVDMESGEIGWSNGNIDGGDIVDANFKVVIPEEIKEMDGYGYDGLDEQGFIINTDNSFSITYKESKPSGGINFEGLCDRVRTVAQSSGMVTFTFSNIRSDIKLAYTEEYMEIGYYFYKDGKFGSDYKDGNTIGIIYKIGKHATDDIANYTGSKLEDNIRGYVVALADENSDGTTGFIWREGELQEGAFLYGNGYPEWGIGGGITTKYLGYPNTQYLIKQAEDVGVQVPAVSTSGDKDVPSGTSGWYLPSHTQLKDLDVLKNVTIPHYTALNSTYWDSSFDGDAAAYKVEFANGSLQNSDHWNYVNIKYKVRLILTF